LIEDVFVADATVHSYNLDPSNLQPNRFATLLSDGLIDVFLKRSPKQALLPVEWYARDWPAESLAEVLFLESQTDLGGHHVLRLDSWFKDGLVSLDKNLELQSRWPQRFAFYCGVDPTSRSCLDDLRRQKELMPGAVGLKMYPNQVEPYRTFRADDPEIAFPLFDLCQELGIRTIAMHKALPIMGLPTDPYRIDDMETAATHYPDLSFELIHAGLAFLEETAHAIGMHRNVYVNLEVTSVFATSVPGLFDEIMSKLLFWGGPEKILYSTGAMEFHPQPILEAIWNYQPGEEYQRKYSLSPLTREDKAKILGENYARIIGLDIEKAKQAIADDEFSRTVAANGLAAPYSHWKQRCQELAPV
jgi:predicted TIM-barrel fold metal-dependent hydrolase